MGSFWLSVKDHLALRFTQIVGAKVGGSDFTAPPKPEMGDLAFACFSLAKSLQINPAELAKKIVADFGNGDRFVDSLSADGPFVNVRLKAGEFIHRQIRDIENANEAYGSADLGKGRELVFEYAQPNTHKEMHVGHLRNLVLGASLVELLTFTNWKTIPVSYHGDVGAHVAKCLWQFVRALRPEAPKQKADVAKQAKKTPVSSLAINLTLDDVERLLANVPKERRNGNYLGELYTEATRTLAEDPDKKDEVSRVQQALESEDPVWHKLWQETRHWSLIEFTELFDELGVNIERQYLESEVVSDGQRMVDELLKKGVAKESEGAIVVDLEDAGLGVFLIRKSDGTSLYATKDLALAYVKQADYPKMTRSVLLVDTRQSLYFRQLFETLKRMGYTVPTEHVGYEFVKLASGAMSSREGNVVTYQEFRDQVYQYAWNETKKRHADWNDGKLRYAAWAIALAGVKFGMLRQDSDKVYTFDMKEALAFEGDTGPYVQYTVVRMNSILKRAGMPDIRGNEEPDCRILASAQEKALALSLARYSDVIARASSELRTNLIANWCLETARLANAFYRDQNVLESEGAVRQARLRLVYATRDVLTRGLKLLGIPVPEEM